MPLRQRLSGPGSMPPVGPDAGRLDEPDVRGDLRFDNASNSLGVMTIGSTQQRKLQQNLQRRAAGGR